LYAAAATKSAAEDSVSTIGDGSFPETLVCVSAQAVQDERAKDFIRIVLPVNNSETQTIRQQIQKMQNFQKNQFG